MSREFAQYEMRKSKCPVCGSRNKLFTGFVDKQTNDKVGYSITCCNCGGVKEFFKDKTKNGLTPIYTRDEYKPSIQRCFQLSLCTHKDDCPLYGTSCKKLSTGCYGDCVNCNQCDDSNSNGLNRYTDGNNCPCDMNQMEVHVHNTPRFL